MATALANAVQEEKDWSPGLRGLVAEGFLAQQEVQQEVQQEQQDNGEPARPGAGSSAAGEHGPETSDSIEEDKLYDGPFGMGDVVYAKDDIYLGGGNGGVFWDYSAA